MGEDDLTVQQAIVLLYKKGILADIDLENATKISPSQGQKTVTAGGTPEALVGSSTETKLVVIQAKKSNTNDVYISGTGVKGVSIVLSARESFAFRATLGAKIDLAELFIDVDTNDEGVNFVYWS